MAEMIRWLDRRFAYEPAAGEFPAIVERLRGAPVRMEEKAARISESTRVRKRGEDWSIQEHLGHLGDIESLWARRVEEFLTGSTGLSAADMSNRATYERNHNERSIAAIVAEFRVSRGDLVQRLDGIKDSDVVRTLMHPRLKRPMRLVDMCFFFAEHDDHHLALVTRLARTLD